MKSPFIEKAIYESCKIKKTIVEKTQTETVLDTTKEVLEQTSQKVTESQEEILKQKEQLLIEQRKIAALAAQAEKERLEKFLNELDVYVSSIRKADEEIVSALEEISSKIRLPSVEIRGLLEIECKKSDGVDIIKKILLDSMTREKDVKVNVSYVGAPKYRLSVTSKDFRSAERTLKPLLSNSQKYIEKNKGTFKFTREDSKKTRES